MKKLKKNSTRLTAVALALLATACSSYKPMTASAPMPSAAASATMPMPAASAPMVNAVAPPMAYNQSSLPAAVQVPTGNALLIETAHKGEIQYQCRIKAGTDNQAAWFFVGPDARITNRMGKDIGRYYGPPATWDATDGSSVVGAQLAVTPNGADNIPLQLVKINASRGNGQFTGTTFVQRVNTKGGVAPQSPCTVASLGNTKFVPYQSDYIFWKAN